MDRRRFFLTSSATIAMVKALKKLNYVLSSCSGGQGIFANRPRLAQLALMRIAGWTDGLNSASARGPTCAAPTIAVAEILTQVTSHTSLETTSTLRLRTLVETFFLVE